MKRLYKSTRDRKVMGVCGGIGEYLGIDPTWIRLVWFFLIWPGWGTPFLIYLFLGIILPSDYSVAGGRSQSSRREEAASRVRDRRPQGHRAADELSDFLRRYQRDGRRRDQEPAPRRDVTPKDDWSDF